MMDERRDLVDREELRRKIEAEVGSGGGVAVAGQRNGLRLAITLLDAMPAVECPRGWTRDKVLAELDADPDAVCEVQNNYTGEWGEVSTAYVRRWLNPDERRVCVRVVRVDTEPEWVPLTQLVGRTIVGEAEPVLAPPLWTVIGDGAEWRWLNAEHDYCPFLEGTLNLETGQVAVRPKAAT